MSDTAPEEEVPTKPKKKGKGLLVKLIGALVIAGAGGGGVFAMVQAGMIGGGEARAKEKDEPKLIRKGEEDPYAPPAAEGDKAGAGGAEVEGEGGSEYRTVYYSFAEDFTSNLRDSEALVQMSLAASTRRDGRVILWIKKHELAIRSELLAVLADTPEGDVTTIAGKQHLQRRLTAAINKVLTDTEGFGGVDAVYFKNLIVQ